MVLAKTYIDEIKEKLYENYKEIGKTSYHINEIHEMVKKLLGFESKIVASYLKRMSIMGLIKLTADMPPDVEITDLLINSVMEKQKKEFESSKIKQEDKEKTDLDGFFKY